MERKPHIHLRVFIASPGDVSYERMLALEVIDQLQCDPFIRGRLTLEPIMWNKPGAGAPMLATMTPQEAVTRGLAKPSECDAVVVIVGSRMGTPLNRDQYIKPDGSSYLSGTEWEYLDAINGYERTGRPQVLVYRRTEEPAFKDSDPQVTEKRRQWRKVKKFFKSFLNDDGSIRRGYNEYQAPPDFHKALGYDLKKVIHDLLQAQGYEQAATRSDPNPLWKASPFPGLRAFTMAESSVFFGREREIDGLIRRLTDRANRFAAIIGDSGSGKSSLVAAGLLPRLTEGAIPGAQDWPFVRFSPGDIGDDPFSALAAGFKASIPGLQFRTRELATTLQEPAGPDTISAAALGGKPEWAELLLFIDQFEEVFTLVGPQHRQSFIDLVIALTRTQRVRVVVTLRADFYSHCLQWPELTQLLRDGSYPLAIPSREAMYEMIVRPSERAGLSFEEGLVSRILDDTVSEPGALTLMAFALNHLYEERKRDGLLTHATYEKFGGVKGAIARRAEEVFSRLDQDTQDALGEVLGEIVEVDDQGVATRRRAPMHRITGSAAKQLVEALAEARLLVKGEGDGTEAVVEVAHEALFERWPRVSHWIDDRREELRLWRQVKLAAAEWDRQDRLEEYMWPDKRLEKVYAMLDRIKVELSEPERSFVQRVDTNDISAELHSIVTRHHRRAYIGDRLAEVGDQRPGVGLDERGLPDIVWCDVMAGEILLEEQSTPLHVFPFQIAKYPVTWGQYRSFLEAKDGYNTDRWWQGLGFRHESAGRQFRRRDNHPAEDVSWYDATAFCAWLSDKLGSAVRLPAEWEWQQAATGGIADRSYPWGPFWDSRYANTEESELNRSTAVGMYPQGASPVGAFDMSGNVWEWCQNQYDLDSAEPRIINDETHRGMRLGHIASGPRPRSVRGGSWSWNSENARVTRRERDMADYRSRNHGFRLARDYPRHI
jgi:conflict system STAND superfamily ATPase/sulfatase-modifying factor enzyme 1